MLTQWPTPAMLSPRERERERERERHGIGAESGSDSIKSPDGPATGGESPASFSDLGRAYQSMMGNGVNFQGSLQAFMDSFVPSSVKNEKDMHGQHFSLEGTEHKIKRTNEGNKEENPTDTKPAQGGRSQYEPLDLSVRPDVAPLPGASITIQDNIAWHACLFCSFTTASVELMALHLQANHMGKAKQGQGKEAKELLIGEPFHTSNASGLANASSLFHLSDGPSSKEREYESGHMKNQTGWPNHLDSNPRGLSMAAFSSDFYRPYSPTIFDGPSRGPAAFLDQQESQSGQASGQDEFSDKASFAEMEASDERTNQSDDDDDAGQEEQSSNPASAEQPMHSDDEDQIADEDEDMEVRDEEDEDLVAIQRHPDSPLSRKDLQRANISIGSQRAGPSPPILEKQWQQQQQQGLMSPAAGPPGLLKPEQAHLEHQMNMFSVLRAYSSESLSTFNGGLAGSSNGGGGTNPAMKRTDPTGESYCQ